MKYIYTTLLLFCFSLFYSQLLTNGAVTADITAKNPFLDASTNFNPNITFDNNKGKGLVFPSTDLTQFEFVDLTDLDGIKFPSAFDGMVVYNTGTGNTSTAQVTTATAVTPGFYYFSNPSSVNQGGTSIAGGQWKPLGATATGNFWSIGGNTGVAAANAKIGTTDNVPVQMISNGNVIQTFGTSSSDAAFKKVIINPNASANTTMAKSKTIGGTVFDFALEVGGKGWFENGIVTSASTYPDYVFDHYFTGKSTVNPNYQFKSLAETEKFIKENNHLPGVTKIDDLAKGGNGYMIDATQLSVQSLEKIEELYLHTIEQQKQIDELKAQIAELKALIKK